MIEILRFLSEIEIDIYLPLMATSEDTIFVFSVCKKQTFY